MSAYKINLSIFTSLILSVSVLRMSKDLFKN